MDKRRGTGGYTLIEFLVAMTMLAIITPALTIAFRTSLDASERIDRRSEATAEARALLSILADDLENAFLPTTAEKGWLVATDSTNGNNPADSITLTTLSGRPSLAALGQDLTPAESEEPLSVYQQVIYTLEPDSEGAGGLLIRSTASPPGEDETVVTDEETISDRVVALNFEYYDGTDWLDDWDTIEAAEIAASEETTGTEETTAAAGEETPPLPLAIRVSIQLLTRDGPMPFTTTVSLPMYNSSTAKIEAEPAPTTTPTTTGGATPATPPTGG